MNKKVQKFTLWFIFIKSSLKNICWKLPDEKQSQGIFPDAFVRDHVSYIWLFVMNILHCKNLAQLFHLLFQPGRVNLQFVAETSSKCSR